MVDQAEHSFHDDNVPGADLPGESGRRRLLAALLAGGVAAWVAPALATSALAADGSSEPRDPADNDRLNAALQREIRMTATLKDAVGATSDQEYQAAFLLIHDHHLAYAQAIKGYLGTAAVTPANTSPLSAVSGTTASVAATLAVLEEETVALHLGTMTQLNGADAASLVASIVTTEARHGAALALVSGTSPDAVVSR